MNKVKASNRYFKQISNDFAANWEKEGYQYSIIEEHKKLFSSNQFDWEIVNNNHQFSEIR